MFVVQLTNMMILFSVNLPSSVLRHRSVLNFESVKKIELGDLNLSAMTLLSKCPTDLTFLFNWQDYCFFLSNQNCWFKIKIFLCFNNSEIQIVHHALNDKTAGYVHITYSHFVTQKFATIIPSLPGRLRNFSSFLWL